MSVGVHLRGLTPGQHSLKKHRSGDDTVSGPGFEL